jgi:hypothetical protein
MASAGNTVEMVNFSPGALDFGTLKIGELRVPRRLPCEQYACASANTQIAILGGAQTDYEETHEGAPIF